MGVETNYRQILERVQEVAARCNRSGEVRLVAVSKAHPVARVADGRTEGCRLFGENYAQELVMKATAIPDVEWHFIGHLQSNKVRAILPFVSLIHSVDRLGLLREIDRRAAKFGRVQPILLEVNVGGEASKSGVAPEGAGALLKDALERTHVAARGLMTIPPFSLEPEETRGYFQRLRAIRDQLSAATGAALPELSMGMSGDFEVAIEEGATLVRVGTAIFGSRTPK